MNGASYNQPGAGEHGDASVADWLRKAAADLQTAERELGVEDNPNYDAVCFHGQQGAEKLMKAALVYRGRTPPRVHDLVHLGSLLREQFPTWSFPTEELSELSSAAVETQYPGSSAGRENAVRALNIATRLWDSLRPRL